MPTKTQEQIEKEILAEAAAEAKKETAAKGEKKPSVLKKVAEAVKKDVAPKEKTDAKKASTKPVPGQKKQSSSLVEKAAETLKGAQEGKDEKEKKEFKGIERAYTIPLRFECPRQKRTKHAIRFIRDFVKRHMHASEVKINEELNEKIWVRGWQKPPHRIRINAVEVEKGKFEVRLLKA